jgi:hypothetical protein
LPIPQFDHGILYASNWGTRRVFSTLRDGLVILPCIFRVPQQKKSGGPSHISSIYILFSTKSVILLIISSIN